jgi:hypothetical protein
LCAPVRVGVCLAWRMHARRCEGGRPNP